VEKFKDHILIRLGLANGDSIITKEQRRQTSIVNQSLYFHATLKVHYTTYDVRRGQDTINCTNLNRERSNVMVLADEEGSNQHQYWYARVLKIFHADVRRSGADKAERMDFLWVRWYGREPAYQAGWKRERLDRIGVLNSPDEQLGFLDPNAVVRACHLIPAFAHGRTEQFLGPSLYRHKDGDYAYYYVNRYVDIPRNLR